MINGEDDLDKVNRYMQDDLAYERDRNLSLQGKLKEEDEVKANLQREMEKTADESELNAKRNQTLQSEYEKRL